jgi:hypothetical protein
MAEWSIHSRNTAKEQNMRRVSKTNIHIAHHSPCYTTVSRNGDYDTTTVLYS